MVDAFAYFHPLAQNRFTCWNQRTNERFNVPDNPYSNNGSRIDYTLFDAPFFHEFVKVNK